MLKNHRYHLQASLILLVLIVCFALIAEASENLFYTQSLEDEFRYDPEALNALKADIEDQSREAAEERQLSIEDELKLLDLKQVSKSALISINSEKVLEYENVTDGILEQIRSVKDVLQQESYAPSTWNPLKSEFLDYCWFIPINAGHGAIINTVVLKNLEHYQVEYSVSTDYVSQNDNYHTWLTDEKTVRDILAGSKEPVDYNCVLPVFFPELDMDIILFVASHEVYGIPFYAGAEQVGLKKGEIIPFEEIENAVLARSEKKTGVKGTSWFEKMLSNPVQRTNFICAVVFCVGLACIAVVFVKRKRRTKENK